MHTVSLIKMINVNVFIDRENKNTKLELDTNSVVSDLLKKLNINPVTVIVSRNNELILEEEELNDNDEVKILSVISGG
jgi:thiamine biosynthesis protein ThiS